MTTLDVLAVGRGMLAIGSGAGFNTAEANGLGLPFPPSAERFEPVEEALEICLQMWSGDQRPYVGRHHRLGRTLNSPQSVRRPHPPTLTGGSGENKTLRLVARYADACNLFDGPELERRLDVLRARCDAIGRDHDEIEKTVVSHTDPGPRGDNVDRLLAHLKDLSDLGIAHAIGTVRGAERAEPLKPMGELVIPVARTLSSTTTQPALRP
jgi:alkanesulfonate monooxygenase SsuD/methylene tetrahydromethanopterin reductase-like flavin-dependent oxidoreductase (luciferase family)